MKAFDVIGAIKEDLKDEKLIIEKEYYQWDQKEQLQISIVKKVQVDSILHEMRKPKFHLIKTKQQPIHVINSKKNGVLGLGTESEEWMPKIERSQADQGFFDILGNMNREAIQIHSNQLATETNLNNPFNRFKEVFNRDLSNFNPFHQSNFQLSQSSINPIQISLMNHSSKPLIRDDGLNPPGQVDMRHQQNFHQSNPSLEISELKELPQNFIQSSVRRVHILDQGQNSDNQDHPHQIGLGHKIINFFSSLKNRISFNNQTLMQRENNQFGEQIAEKGSKLRENANLSTSSVREYLPAGELKETIQQQIVIEQSIVIQNH